MKSQKRNKRGLAILTTLLILSLLLALIAAFLTVNRAGNLFTLNSIERRQTQDICMTAFNYAWFQLEKERSWGDGTTPITASEQYPIVQPQVRMTQVQGEDILTINGEYSPNGNFSQPLGDFTMTVENNLQSRTPMDGVSGPVPARSVRVSVVANIGTVKRELAALLRPIPTTHDSLSAGRNLNLEDGLIRIESRDPYVNRIRAGENLNLPEANNVQFLKHGTGASSDQLNLGGTDLATATDAQKLAAGEASGGRYETGVPAPDVKEFDPTKITLPNTNSNIAAGTWTFGEITSLQHIPHPLSYETSGPGPDGTVVRYQRRTSVYNRLTSPSGQVWVAGTALEGTTVFDPPYPPDGGTYESLGDATDYGYGAGQDGFFQGDQQVTPTGVPSDVHTIVPGFKANVMTAQMAILPSYALRAPGDFLVEAAGDRAPELYFGYDLNVGGVAEQRSLDLGVEAAQSDPGSHMAAIIADGDVNITGGVLGYGSMIAGGDLTIKASSGLRAAPDLGVVVKGNRIIIEPATEPEPGIPGAPVDGDYPIFRDAIQADTGGDWSQYNNWLEHEQPVRNNLVDSLKTQSTGNSPSVMWNTLCTQIGESFPAPNFTALGWTGPVTVDQYVRMKEFLQTRATGYNDGDGDPTWLDLSVRQEDSAGRVKGVLNGIAQWARSYKQSFQAYLTTPEQTPPDMFLAGLVYADEDITINADGKTVRLEGAVVAKNGDVSIIGPSQVGLVYNRTLLDDLFASDGTGSAKLEKVFFTLE